MASLPQPPRNGASGLPTRAPWCDRGGGSCADRLRLLRSLRPPTARGLECYADRLRVAYDGHIAAAPLDLGLAERNRVLTFGDLALGVVQHLAFDENDWIVVPDGGLEQSLGVCRCGRHDDLQSRDVCVVALERLRMLRTQLECCAAGSPKHGGHANLSA